MIFEEGDGVAKKCLRLIPRIKKINLLADSSENVIEIKKDVLIFISGRNGILKWQISDPPSRKPLNKLQKTRLQLLKKYHRGLLRNLMCKPANPKCLLKFRPQKEKAFIA